MVIVDAVSGWRMGSRAAAFVLLAATLLGTAGAYGQGQPTPVDAGVFRDLDEPLQKLVDECNRPEYERQLRVLIRDVERARQGSDRNRVAAEKKLADLRAEGAADRVIQEQIGRLLVHRRDFQTRDLQLKQLLSLVLATDERFAHCARRPAPDQPVPDQPAPIEVGVLVGGVIAPNRLGTLTGTDTFLSPTVLTDQRLGPQGGLHPAFGAEVTFFFLLPFVEPRGASRRSDRELHAAAGSMSDIVAAAPSGGRSRGIEPFVRLMVMASPSRREGFSFTGVNAFPLGDGSQSLERLVSFAAVLGVRRDLFSLPGMRGPIAAELFGGVALSIERLSLTIDRENGAPGGPGTSADSTRVFVDPIVGARLSAPIGRIGGVGELRAGLTTMLRIGLGSHSVRAQSQNFASQSYLAEHQRGLDLFVGLSLSLALGGN